MAHVEFKIMKSNWFIASYLSPWHNDFTNDNDNCMYIVAMINSLAYAVRSDLQLEVVLDLLISEQQNTSPGSNVVSRNSERVWTVYLIIKQFLIIFTKCTKKKNPQHNWKMTLPNLICEPNSLFNFVRKKIDLNWFLRSRTLTAICIEQTAHFIYLHWTNCTF